MTLAQTYSWIFYAAGLASQASPTTFARVEGVADGINHVIPTRKEMQESISWAVSQGLVVKEGNTLKVTKEGLALLTDASAASNKTSEVWEYLEKRFAELGVENALQVDPNTMNTEEGNPADRPAVPDSC
jgi:hypothetical protein